MARLLNGIEAKRKILGVAKLCTTDCSNTPWSEVQNCGQYVVFSLSIRLTDSISLDIGHGSWHGLTLHHANMEGRQCDVDFKEQC